MRDFIIRASVCTAVLGWCVFSYLETQTSLTDAKIQLPKLEKEIASIREEAQRIQYEIDQFQAPNHLIEMAHRPEYSHLKHPLLKEILTVPEAIASNE
jgi:hypothetical protein